MRGAKFRVSCGIKTAAVSFVISAFVMTLSVFILSCFTSVKEDSPAEKTFVHTGLEPYFDGQSSELPASEALDAPDSEKLSEQLLASAIESVVGGESYAARVAFGAVIVNRMKSALFPSSVASVMMSAGIYPRESIEISDRSVHAARDALAGVDPTLGALYVIRTDDTSFEAYADGVTVIYGKYAFIK